MRTVKIPTVHRIIHSNEMEMKPKWCALIFCAASLTVHRSKTGKGAVLGALKSAEVGISRLRVHLVLSLSLRMGAEDDGGRKTVQVLLVPLLFWRGAPMKERERKKHPR